MKQVLFDEMLDLMLKHALSEEGLLLEKELAEAEALEARQPTVFSPEHEGAMKALFKDMDKYSRRQKKFYRQRWFQIAAACIALFICLVAASPPVSAAKNPIIRFFALMREKSISILTPEQEERRKEREEGEDSSAELPVQASLGYVPDGYMLTDSRDLERMRQTVYEKDDGSMIIFGQFPETAAMEIDGEDSQVREFFIDDRHYLLSYKEQQYIVVWVFQGYKFNLTLLGDSS